MRFDKHFVESMRETVWKYHALNEEFDKFPDFYMVQNPGRGTGYVNIGGEAGYWGVQYGPQGARRVVAYLYGLGVATGAWERVRTESPELFTAMRTMSERARTDLEQEEFDAWAQMGRNRVERFREWSAMGD